MVLPFLIPSGSGGRPLLPPGAVRRKSVSVKDVLGFVGVDVFLGHIDHAGVDLGLDRLARDQVRDRLDAQIAHLERLADLLALQSDNGLDGFLGGLRDYDRPPCARTLWGDCGLPEGFDDAALLAYQERLIEERRRLIA